MSHADNHPRTALTKASFLVAAALQLGCGAVFVSDVVVEWRHMSTHTWVEALAIMALAIGGYVSLREYQRVVRRNQRVENELSAASGAFQDVIEQHFETWGLSAAERDVALLSIKGVTIAEIAKLRSTKEGTIKAQSAAIYKKVGVSSRAELISVVIEDMVSGLSLASQKHAGQKA